MKFFPYATPCLTFFVVTSQGKCGAAQPLPVSILGKERQQICPNESMIVVNPSAFLRCEHLRHDAPAVVRTTGERFQFPKRAEGIFKSRHHQQRVLVAYAEPAFDINPGLIGNGLSQYQR